MRKLAILAIVAAPVSVFGAYAFAAGDEPALSDSQMTVDSHKGDQATSDQSTQLFAMEGSGESEAGPILSNDLNFGEANEGEHDSDD